MHKFLGPAAAILLCATPAAYAQSFPDKPIEIVVAYAPGGGTDIIGRLIASGLSKKFGKPVVVNNIAGATGQIGSQHVARSKPDGYTLQIAVQTTHAVAPTLYGKINYDPIADFTPIIRVVGAPLVLVTHSKLGVKSLQDMVAYIRARPTEISHATGGVGDGGHLSAMIFNKMLNVNPTYIPHQGEGPALTQVMGGHLPYMFALIPTVAPYIQNGLAIPLAVTSEKRSPRLPDVPTMQEAGLKGYQMETWWGIFGPAKMPQEVVATLNAAINEILRQPETATKITELGYEIRGSTPQEFGEFVKEENVRWKEIITSQGLAGLAGR